MINTKNDYENKLNNMQIRLSQTIKEREEFSKKCKKLNEVL
jgi:uncharacterized protein YeeX (DUF496 family)